MRAYARLATVPLALLVSVSCYSSKPRTVASDTSQVQVGGDVASVRSILEANNKAFADAMLKGDTAAVTAMYAEDAISYQQYAEPVQGKANIGKSIRDWFAGMKYTEAAAVMDEMYPVGPDMVLQIGRYSGKGTTLGKPSEDHGRYMNLWKKQPDGSWKIFRDISTSSVPPKI